MEQRWCICLCLLFVGLASAIKPGIDNDISLLYGKRVGLITNPSGVNHELVSTIDVLFADSKTQLVALFAPEHGIRGDKPPGILFPDYKDPVTGLPVYSLYAPDGTRAPTKKQIEESAIDVIALDLQDVGTRVYTWETTLARSLKSTKNLSVEFVVLDRVNPIGAHDDDVQGPILDPRYFSGIGVWNVTMQHAMTMGELAFLFNEEMDIHHPGLHVIKNVYSQNENPRDPLTYENARWILPSPNIPTLLTSFFYPGMVLFEALGNVSLGRGTTTPFFVIGAPFINNLKIISDLRKKIQSDPSLEKIFEDIRIIPIFFVPTTDIHTGDECSGIHLISVRPEKFSAKNAIPVALTILQTLLDNYSVEILGLRSAEFRIRIGNDQVLQQLLAKVPIMKIMESFSSDIQNFQERRKKYLLYP